MIIKKNLFNLQNGAYIVTGGCGLLGKAHCHAIAAFGGVPVIIDLNTDNSDLLKEEFKQKYNLELKIFNADITSKTALEDLCRNLSKDIEIFGLVNNAARNPVVDASGLKNSTRMENFSLKDWDLDLKVGLTGSFLCTQVFGTYMASKSGGSIVNISSDLGLIAPKQSLYKTKNTDPLNQPVKPVTYSVVKSGLIGLTRYTSTYWPQKIKCNCLCPGGVFNNQSEEFLKKVYSEIPMSRLANVNEYAGALVFLLGESSSYMNGAVISIDGGRTAW